MDSASSSFTEVMLHRNARELQNQRGESGYGKSVKEGAGIRKRRITLHGAAESLRILRMKGLS